MIYFDCCCEIGPRNEKDPAAPWSVDDVLAWMDHCGIDGALVVHTLSIQDDPVHARKRLKDEISRAPKRLFPVWVLLPPDAGDFEGTADELLVAMAAENVCAVKLFPKTHNYPLSPSVLGNTLQALEKQHILTMIDFNELPNGADGAYTTLGTMLKAYPRLPLLLQRVPWSMQRVITALMDRYANLHIEFSTYQINRGIEKYVERFGHKRLLFGTGLPAMSAGAARAYVDYAQVPRSAKENIAGGNLSRLLGGIRPEQAPPRSPDPLCQRAEKGEALTDFPVLDAHCHLLHEGGHAAGATVMYNGDADGLLEIKNVLGVQKTAIMSWSGPIASDPIESNEIIARAVQKYPQRFLGVVYINPAHLSQEELISEVRRRIEEQEFVGVKPYVRVGIRYTDPLYATVWEYVNSHGLYVLMHTEENTGGMNAVKELAQRYPHAQWVIAHSGGSFVFAREVCACMKEHANVWAELTLTPVTNGVIEWMVSEVGDERILFGTDAPMRDPRPQFGWVIWANIPVESRIRILGKNFQRLLAIASKAE